MNFVFKFANILKINRNDFYHIVSYYLDIPGFKIFYDNIKINFKQKLQIITAFIKLKRGIPLPYILKIKHFYDENIYINRSVLIPRNETELIIEYINSNEFFNKKLLLLDIGTGSGCISILIKKYNPWIEIDALDINKKALKTARLNALRILQEDNKINFTKKDIMKEKLDKKYDVIIMNPPYIPEHEYINLDNSVKKYEPKKALLAGKTGYEFYIKLASILPEILKLNGKIILETGYNQSAEIKKIFGKFFKKINFIKDYSGYDRIFIGEIYEG